MRKKKAEMSIKKESHKSALTAKLREIEITFCKVSGQRMNSKLGYVRNFQVSGQFWPMIRGEPLVNSFFLYHICRVPKIDRNWCLFLQLICINLRDMYIYFVRYSHLFDISELHIIGMNVGMFFWGRNITIDSYRRYSYARNATLKNRSFKWRLT